MVALPAINSRITSHKPEIINCVERREAAVSLILANGTLGAEMLFIERACRSEDPWSGQMAFPGGKRDPQDQTVLLTAQRETFEEVGLELHSNHHIGRLDDIVAPRGSPAEGLIVSCHVFNLTRYEEVSSNEEVHDTVWIPVRSLTDSRNFVADYRPANYRGSFPGIRVSRNDDRVIWGLTYRLLCGFFTVCGLNHDDDSSFSKNT